MLSYEIFNNKCIAVMCTPSKSVCFCVCVIVPGTLRNNKALKNLTEIRMALSDPLVLSTDTVM